MFAHISLGVTSLKKSLDFYDAVMKTLGHDRLFGDEKEEFMAYGPNESFFIINTPLNPERGVPEACNGTHVCFRAKSKQQVDDFYSAAMEEGATCDGKPGVRKDYSPTYYAAYILDLDGHKLEAVYSE